MMRTLVGLLGVVFIVAGCTTTTTVARGDPEAVEREQQHQMELYIETMLDRLAKMAGLAFPILTANADLCGEGVKPLAGVSWLTDEDLGGVWERYQGILTQRYGVSDRPTVINVVEGGPAEAAGLRRWDVLLTVDSKPIPTGRFGNPRDEIAEMIEAAAADGQIHLLYERDGRTLSTTLRTVTGCGYDVVLLEDHAINAFADGRNIYITMGMYRFVENDAELQAVIAHELAHNSEGHIDKTLGNFALGSILDIVAAYYGVNTEGAFGALATMAFSQEFEREADYVSMYMLEKAGVDTSEISTFWRRMAVEHPDSITFAASHPTSAERFTNLDATYAEIQRKRESGKSLNPSRK